MLSLLFLQTALASDCGSVTVEALSSIEAPAIIVLGERHGTTKTGSPSSIGKTRGATPGRSTVAWFSTPMRWQRDPS